MWRHAAVEKEDEPPTDVDMPRVSRGRAALESMITTAVFCGWNEKILGWFHVPRKGSPYVNMGRPIYEGAEEFRGRGVVPEVLRRNWDFDLGQCLSAAGRSKRQKRS